MKIVIAIVEYKALRLMNSLSEIESEHLQKREFEADTLEDLIEQVIEYVRTQQNSYGVIGPNKDGPRRLVSMAKLSFKEFRNDISIAQAQGRVIVMGCGNVPNPKHVNLASSVKALLPVLNVAGVVNCICGHNSCARNDDNRAIRRHWEAVQHIGTKGFTCPECGQSWYGVNVALSTYKQWKRKKSDIDWDSLSLTILD